MPTNAVVYNCLISLFLRDPFYRFRGFFLRDLGAFLSLGPVSELIISGDDSSQKEDDEGECNTYI